MTNSSTLPVPRSERLIGLVLCDTFQRFDLLKPAFEKKAMERNAIGMIINNMIDGNNGKYIYILMVLLYSTLEYAWVYNC